MEDTNKIISTEPVLDIYTELQDKYYEVRCKRDAVSLIHQQLNNESNKFNKIIIFLSLFTGFLETLKFQLDLTNKEKYGTATTNTAGICPIFLSTLIAIISSLIKFKKYPETMELLTTALIKLNNVINKIRSLQECLHYSPLSETKKTYKDVILTDYRTALLEIESSIYPSIRHKFFNKAQYNIIRQLKNDIKYNNKIKKILNSNDTTIIGIDEISNNTEEKNISED